MTLLSVYSVINFKNITDVLGLNYENCSSVSGCCPFCEAYALSVHCDSGNQEDWIYCHQCKRSAGVIAMAAHLLSMSEHDTVKFLADKLNIQLSDTELAKLRKTSIRKARYAAFWTAAQNNLLRLTSEHKTLLRQRGFELPLRMTRRELLDGPGHLFGLSTVSEIRNYTKDYYQAKTGSNVIVIPFYRNQSEIIRFALMSGRGTAYISRSEVARVERYKGTSRYSTRPVSAVPGLAGLPLLYQSNSSSVVVTSSLPVFIQMHLSNFRSSNVPLSLLAWEQHATKRDLNCWSVLGGRKIVIWDSKPSSALLQLALSSGCHMSFDCPASLATSGEKWADDWQKWICRTAGADTYNRIVERSQPYKVALKRWLKRAGADQVATLIRDCEQSSEATSAMVRSLVKNHEASRLGRKIYVSPRLGQRCRRIAITELDGKWYDCHHDVILPAILRVQKIVNRSGSGDQSSSYGITDTYVGYIEADGKRHNYAIPVKTPVVNNRAIIKFLRSLSVSASAYQPRDSEFNPKYLGEPMHYFQTAMTFQRPKIVQAIDSVGWDGSGFQLKRGRIMDGVVTKTPSYLFHPGSGGPSLNINDQNQMKKPTWDLDSYESEIAMVLLLAICAQVTAPAANLTCKPIICMLDEITDFLLSLCKFLGVLEAGDRVSVKTVNWPEIVHRNLLSHIKTNWSISMRTKQASHKQHSRGLHIDASKRNHTYGLCKSNSPAGVDVMLVRYLIEQSKTCNLFLTSSWQDWLLHTGMIMRQVFGPEADNLIDKAESRLSIH